MSCNECFVVFELSVIEAATDDLAAERIEFGLEIVLQAFAEKFSKNFRTLEVRFFADLGLGIDLKEPAGNHAAFDLELVQRVTEQRAKSGAQLLGPKFSGAASGQVLARNPLRHKADPPGSDMLIRTKDVTHARVLGKLPQEEVGLVDPPPRGKRPIGANAFTGTSFPLDH